MSFHGLPCWYELATSDTARAKAFYSKVLGWSWADSGTPGMTYLLASAGSAMVAGMMQGEAGQPQAWTLYFAVDDCDATVEKAAALGAKIYVPPADIPGTGRFAVLCDPQGAGFALLEPLPGGSGGAFDQAKPGHGNWHELVAPDTKAAMAFYGALFGWTISRSVPMGPELSYHIIARDGLEIGGTCALPGAPTMWKPYFGVSSASAAVKDVEAAGGKVLHGPDEVPGGAFTLQVADVQAVPFALVGPA